MNYDMPKLLQRLLIFFIGIPLVIFAIIPQFYNHLPLHILIFLFTFMSAWELTTILSTNSQIPNKILLIVLSMTLPIASYLCGLFNLEFVIVELTLTFDILIIFTIEIFSNKDILPTLYEAHFNYENLYFVLWEDIDIIIKSVIFEVN